MYESRDVPAIEGCAVQVAAEDCVTTLTWQLRLARSELQRRDQAMDTLSRANEVLRKQICAAHILSPHVRVCVHVVCIAVVLQMVVSGYAQRDHAATSCDVRDKHL
jgi:hypothetical protein